MRYDLSYLELFLLGKDSNLLSDFICHSIIAYQKLEKYILYLIKIEIYNIKHANSIWIFIILGFNVPVPGQKTKKRVPVPKSFFWRILLLSSKGIWRILLRSPRGIWRIPLLSSKAFFCWRIRLLSSKAIWRIPLLSSQKNLKAPVA